MYRVYTQMQLGQRWLDRHRGLRPVFACILGFTDTGLIPGISAAGATPADRRYTCLADAEFLCNGPTREYKYPLPPLDAGVSPVLISRAVVAALDIPVYLFNGGLPEIPSVPTIDLGGAPARCVTTGKALELGMVKQLWHQGLSWGEKLGREAEYLIVSECVVGGTTTALALLTALGIPAAGKINSSHPTCNHAQKWDVVQAGLQAAGEKALATHPLELVAAVGDPMQVVAAGMAIAASRTTGVMLAGGTQMLAVYGLMQAIARKDAVAWQPEQVVVGTTRWVAEDPTGDTVGLANSIGSVPLIATQLSFASSRFPQLVAYERGFVKEGVGCGGCAIAASLYQGWKQMQLLQEIEDLIEIVAREKYVNC
ncbi:MAG: TIGR00303 family protein [Hormoscilla sp. GM7CHS1pb]|nr:TIGR00303 family protein [Hormoscilla sp. GM7CHS1pb]